MNALNLLQEFKSKIEQDAQITEEPRAMTDISGNKAESTAIVIKEVEGKLQMIEIKAKVLITDYADWHS